MANRYPAKNLESQDKELINIVKTNDWIFNKDKRYSYNEESKLHFWLQIRAKLAERGFSVPDPRARWQQLRDQFVRHDKNGNRKWIYFADMSFLLSHIRHKDKRPAKSLEWQNSSSNLTRGSQVESLGNEASTSKDSLSQRPVLVVATSSHSTENEVQPQGVVELVRVSNSSCSPEEFHIPHYNLDATSDIGTVQLIDHVQLIANEYEFDPPRNFNTQSMDNVQVPSSKFTFATPSQDTNWGQTSAISQISSCATSKEPIVDSVFPPDYAIEEDSSCLTRVSVQSVPLPSESSVIDMGHEITPPSSCTKLTMRGNSTSVIPRVDTSFRIPVSDSSCGSSSGSSSASSSGSSPAGRRASLTATHTSGARIVPNTNRDAESSRVSTHLAQKNPPKSSQRRPIAVPCSDAFAKKKKKEASKSEATEEAIIGCSNDLREMSSEFKDLIRLKKELVKARLQEGRVDVDTARKSSLGIESGDGFFNLLQKEWLKLPFEIQDELFAEILDVMEEFGVE